MQGSQLAQATPKSAPLARGSWLDRNEKALFIVPAVIAVLVLSIFPMIASLGLSFVNWNISNPKAGIQFVGFGNWARIFTDSHFQSVAVTTIAYTVIAVPIQYAVGVLLAYGLSQGLKGQRFFRLLFLLPMMLSPVCVSFIVGRMMFDEIQGPVNGLFGILGIPAVQWLSTGKMAFWTVLLVDSWQWIPFMILLLLAGLQALPQEILEAAKMDARSEWQTFRYVTFPLLLPWSATAVLLRSLEMLKMVDLVTVLTNGGPGIATETLTLYAYRVGLKNTDIGYASVIAYTLLFFAIVVSTVFLVGARRSIRKGSL